MARVTALTSPTERDLDWIAVVPAGAGQVPLILAAQRAGIQVVAVDGSAGAPGHALAQTSLVVDLEDTSCVVEQLSAANVGAVASTGSELGMIVTTAWGAFARVADSLPLEAARLARDKSAQFWLLRRLGVRTPHTIVLPPTVAEAGDIPNGVRKHSVVIKPADHWGSIGTTVLAPHEAGNDDLVAEAIATAIDVSKTSRALAQSYVPGPEYSINVACLSGAPIHIGLARKLKRLGEWRSRGLYPVAAYSHRTVYRAPQATIDVWEMSARVIHAVAPTWTGVMNVDAVLTRRGATIIEFSFRGGGNGLSLLLDSFFGSRFLEMELGFRPKEETRASRRWPFRLDLAGDLRPVSVFGSGRDLQAALCAGPNRSSSARMELLAAYAPQKEHGCAGTRGGSLVFLGMAKSSPFPRPRSRVMEDLLMWGSG